MLANTSIRRIRFLSAVLGLGLSVGVMAAQHEPEDGIFSFNAFGTLGIAHSDSQFADFNRSSVLPEGAGASHSWSPAVDSLLAGQVRANFAPRWSATVQVVSELRYDKTYRPSVEWGYLAWDVTPDFALRLGRTSSPTFMITDTRRLAYAQHWIRPPSEVYDLIPVTSNDGVDAVWHTRAFGITHTLQAAYGRSAVYTSPRGLAPSAATSDHQLTVRYGFEKGVLSGYANLGRDRLSVEGFEGLMRAFSQFGPQGQSIADRYGTLAKKGMFYGTGATYDPGRWFAMGEWARTVNPSLFGTKTGWYVSGGVRIGPFTPYVTWSDVDVNSNKSDPGLDLGTLPPPAIPVAAGLNAALNGILGTNGDYSTLATGLRWDFAPDFTFKMQFEHIDISPGSWGPLTNLQPGFVPGSTVRVFSAAVSFIL
jgi:hypothetical protein